METPTTTLSPAPNSVLEHLNKLHPAQETATGKTEVSSDQVIQAEKIKQEEVKRENENIAEVENQIKQEKPPAEIKTETKPEPKAQETKTPEGDTPPEVKNEQVSWLDLNPAEGTTTEPAKEGAVADFQTKAKAWDAVMADPQMEVIFKAVQAGKRPFDVIQELQPVDYTTMDASAVAENYGKLQGYTPEQISEAAQWLEDLPLVQKNRELNLMRAELNQHQEGRLSQAAQGFEKTIADQDAIYKQFNADMQKEKAIIVDKEFFGTKLTRQDADAFENWVRTEFPKHINEDGTFNVAYLRNFWLGAAKIPAIQKANLSNGATQGRKEVLQEVHRPAENSSSVTKVPEAKPPASPQETATAIAQKAFGGR